MRIRDRVLLPAALALLSGYAPAGFSQQTESAAARPGEGEVLAEVVITAEKRTEKLSDAPVAASVVSSAQLQSDNATDVSDLNKLVPSMDLNQTVSGRVPLALRGYSSVSNEAAIGIASGVAIEVDGVPVPSHSPSRNALYDVADVEVLKGPQGTLGGRAAAAGVVNSVTKGPSDTFTGSASVEYTTDREKLVQGFMAGPLSDKIEFSLAAYSDRKFLPITNLQTGDRLEQDLYGARAKLLLKLTDDLDIKVTQFYGMNETFGGDFVYDYLAPGATLFPFLPGGLPVAQAIPGVTPSLDNAYYTSPIANQTTDRHQNNTNLDINYRFGGYTLSSTTAYQHEEGTSDQNLFLNGQYLINQIESEFGIPAPPFNNLQVLTQDTRQISEEVKLISPATGPFTYVAGLFYSDTDVNLDTTRNLFINFNNGTVFSGTQSSAVYGRGTWKLNDAISIIGGLRYNHDNISYAINQFMIGGGCVFCDSAGSSSSSTVVGDLTLQLHFLDSSMAYLTYARGYAPQAYNTAATLCPGTFANGALASPQPSCAGGAPGASFNGAPGHPGSVPPLVPVDKESINHFELGLKGSFFDHKLSLDAALFDTIYNNYQVSTYITQGPPPSVLTFEAAGQAQTRGAELNVQMLPAINTRVSLNMAYIHAVFTDWTDAPCWTGEPVSQCVSVNGNAQQNVSGQTMPMTPKFKGVIAAEQRIPLSGSADITLGGDYTYRTSAQMLPDEDPFSIEPAYGIANFHLSYNAVAGSGNFDATLFVNNAFNQFYVTDMEDFFSGLWGNGPVVIAQPARDARRYGGLQLNYSW